ncbi:MAG: TOBE domain-containing protein [Microthrixaceae bacterium]
MASYKLSQVAEILGVSPDTVRRWCDEGRLRSSEREGRTRTIDGASLAEYLRNQSSAYEPESVLQQSARNRFTGIITSVERDKLVAVVEIHAPPHRLVSMMTREAADELNLQPGDLATAAVKSTNVTVELPRV